MEVEVFIETALTTLGFTTWESGLWNGAAYITILIIILAVYLERWINQVVFVGGIFLGIYAWFFLHDPLFTTLQGVIAFSALLQLLSVPRYQSIGLLTITTMTAYVILLSQGVISDPVSVMGSIGLLGIAFGLIFIPSALGFAVLATGSVLLSGYSWFTEVWAFLFLNIFFAVVNIRSVVVNMKKNKCSCCQEK